MPDAFPDTPVSLLACIEERRGGMPYQDAWRSFFDLYHGPIRAVALGTFRRYNWNQVPETLLDEVVADVVVSFFKAEFRYDPAYGRFRNYLRQLTAWRIMDKLGKLPAPPPAQLESIADLADPFYAHRPDGELDGKEQDIYRASLFATMLEDVRRNKVGPETFVMFEMVKIQGISPDDVAKQFGAKRNKVDNAVYRVMKELRKLAAQPEYRKEYEA